MIFTNFQIKFLDKEATMVKLGSSAGVGAGVDLKEKEEVKGGQSNASSAFTISSDICPHICLVGDQWFWRLDARQGKSKICFSKYWVVASVLDF